VTFVEISVQSSFLYSDRIVVVPIVVAVRTVTNAEEDSRVELIVEEDTPPLTSAVEGYGSRAFEMGTHPPAASADTFAVRIRTRAAGSQTPLGNAVIKV
jgi:hypothetical protein